MSPFLKEVRSLLGGTPLRLLGPHLGGPGTAQGTTLRGLASGTSCLLRQVAHHEPLLKLCLALRRTPWQAVHHSQAISARLSAIHR